jgi:quinohemoprotein ethanol dehydrogenase
MSAAANGSALGAATQNWPNYNGGPDAAHASALAQINDQTVSRLGLAFSVDLGDPPGGATEAIEMDGIIYAALGPSVVHAVDVRAGKELWSYDPDAYARAGIKMRFSWGIRGLAYLQGRIFVGTVDGRLIGLDAKSGKPLWSVQTTMPGDSRYITGAPLVFGRTVVIGHGGADVGPTRGYVTAYDAATGKQRWRFFTVPGDPAKGFEDEAQAKAAKTWTGEWWKGGGGGTVWNAMTYDPEQNLVYLGTGNGNPHNRRVRSPGGGDNLFLNSIVALDATTGKYRWHFQQTPGDSWDYNSSMDMELATLVIDGKPRKVLMQAPKNGFFYVIDRTNGQFIGASQFADKVTWATGIDPKTGRPIEAPNADYKTPQVLWPGVLGAHNWAPMSFNAATGLVYIPTREVPGFYSDGGASPNAFKFVAGRFEDSFAMMSVAAKPDAGYSYLQAFDPVRGKRIWQFAVQGAWAGGTLTTGGNLVFLGAPDGFFRALAADTGKLLWSFDAGLGIVGAPMSFEVDGTQYIAVVAGWGSVGAGGDGGLANVAWQPRGKRHQLYVFELGGAATRPQMVKPERVTPIDDPAFVIDPATAEAGSRLYAVTCMGCHSTGVQSSGYAPDLRTSPIVLQEDSFAEMLRAGSLESRGMPRYSELTGSEMHALRSYIRQRAREDLATLGRGATLE